VCSENEIKQLQGWKATVENLLERFDDLLKQAQMLQELDDARAMSGGSSSSSSASRMEVDGDVQSAAEEGLLGQGPLAAGVAHMGRTSLLTASHAVQLNKLRCAAEEAVLLLGHHGWTSIVGEPYQLSCVTAQQQPYYHVDLTTRSQLEK
jgi:hypothetical protein